MIRAIRFHENGGPETLRFDEVEVGDPGPGQVRLRHTAIGVNFIDTYQRSGLYRCRPCRRSPGARGRAWWRPWARRWTG